MRPPRLLHQTRRRQLRSLLLLLLLLLLPQRLTLLRLLPLLLLLPPLLLKPEAAWAARGAHCWGCLRQAVERLPPDAARRSAAPTVVVLG